jgi:hypothetical protein
MSSHSHMIRSGRSKPHCLYALVLHIRGRWTGVKFGITRRNLDDRIRSHDTYNPFRCGKCVAWTCLRLHLPNYREAVLAEGALKLTCLRSFAVVDGETRPEYLSIPNSSGGKPSGEWLSYPEPPEKDLMVADEFFALCEVASTHISGHLSSALSWVAEEGPRSGLSLECFWGPSPSEVYR